jgi:glycolate oxidase iron-sulfur subunit
MVAATLLRQCVHCGLCLDACPTYLQLGAEPDSPRGRIHLIAAVSAGTLPLSPAVVRHLDLCLGCRACESACPSGVRYGQILEDARAEIESAGVRRPVDRWRRRLLLELFPHPRRMRVFMQAVRVLRAAGIWRAVEALVPPARLLPLLGAPRPVRASAAETERGRVELLSGCVASVLQPEVNAAAVRVLNRSGLSVDLPAAQGCCGALHLHAGAIEEARRLARVNVDAFGDRTSAVVVTAAGCGATMREYGDLLRDDPVYGDRAARLAERVRDVTEIVGEPPRVESPSVGGVRVTYHDACHLAHAQGIREAPRRILRGLPGVEFVELAESDVCCGSAGSYNLTEPEMAAALGRRKVDNIERAGVDCVAVANPGCAMQIQAELRRRGSAVRVAHPVELLDESCDGS